MSMVRSDCSRWKKGARRVAVARLEQVAGDVRVHHAVGERIADAGGRLGMVVDDAPASVGFARQVDGVEVQVARLGHDAVAGAEERGVGKKEGGRDEAVAQQLLLAVGVGEDGVQQAGALDERRLQPAPLAAREDERDEVDFPTLSGRGRIGEDVVGDAHFAHAPVEAFGALRLLGGGQLGKGGEKRPPVGADDALRVHQFVVAAAAQARIALEQAPIGLKRQPRFQVHD